MDLKAVLYFFMHCLGARFFTDRSSSLNTQNVLIIFNGFLCRYI